MLSLEKLDRRELFAALVEATALLAPQLEATALNRKEDILQVGLASHQGEISLLQYNATDLEQLDAIALSLLPESVDAAIVEIDGIRVIAESVSASGVDLIVWDSPQNPQILRTDAGFVDAVDHLLLSDEASGSILSRTQDELTLPDDFFAAGIDQSAGFVFGDNFQPLAYPIEEQSRLSQSSLSQSSLSIAAPVYAMRPTELEANDEFFGSYLASFQTADTNRQAVGVFEFVAMPNTDPQLLLGLADLASGQYLGSIGPSFGQTVIAENGVVAIETIGDVELMVQSEYIASLLSVQPSSRVSVSQLLDDPNLEILRLVDIETDGYRSLQFLLEVHNKVDGEIQNLIYSIEDVAPEQNPVNKYDVNNDGHVSALDALIVINVLARDNGGMVGFQLTVGAPFYDVGGDNFVSAIDALLVINELARRQFLTSSQGEALAPGVCLLDQCYVSLLDDDLNERQYDVYWQLAL